MQKKQGAPIRFSWLVQMNSGDAKVKQRHRIIAFDVSARATAGRPDDSVIAE